MRRGVYRLLVIPLFAALPSLAANRTYGSRNVARSKGMVSKARSVGGHTRTASRKCTSCERDANGRIKRNPAKPAGVPKAESLPKHRHNNRHLHGYAVDHIVSLKRGGPDQPSNMQWLTVADAKAKDRVE
jgi:hypothetical protein